VYGLIPFVDSVGLNCGFDWDWILGGGVVVSFLTQQFHVVVFQVEKSQFRLVLINRKGKEAI
jgi:hypothetical protein